jgi:flagellar protein FlbD
MIMLTRLNGKELVVNAELIRFVEETPDTMLTLITGDKLMVKEPMQEVVRRAVDYSRSLRKLVPPT